MFVLFAFFYAIIKIKKLCPKQNIIIIIAFYNINNSFLSTALRIYGLCFFGLCIVQGGGGLNRVEPIRDKELINDIAGYLKLKNSRDALLFLFGIYSGLRVSDIIKLRVRDVRGKDRVVVKETKTGKDKFLKINHALRKEIAVYVKDMKDYEVLFKSKRGINKPISRQQAYNIINSAGKHFGMERIGTHTMRKTFGYHIYQQTKDITLVQQLLNHSSPEITMAYIGLTQKTMEDAVDSLDYR